MGKRRERRFERVIVDLSYWFEVHWRLILFLFGLAGLVLAVVLWATPDYGLPAVEEEAEIMRFGVSSGDEGNRPLVIVRTKDGQILQLHIHPRTTLYCRRGSMIRLLRRGSIITVDPRGCAPRAS